MKAIQTGTVFKIFDDSIQTHDLLPAVTFEVHYSQTEGCYLVRRSNLTVDEKTYGVQKNKVARVLNSYKNFGRSFGVILSGDKGIGKSMFARSVCVTAMQEGYPIIIVDSCLPGIARFIASIEQECVVLFDEFDKTFRSNDDRDDQAALLSLFDGTCGGKKLFVVTCNELYSLNSYIVNRPGRFHYHFRFDYPTPEDITEYLHDKLDEAFYGEIKNVVEFSKKVSLNYDCLRAIAFELNQGTSFADAIYDLNIMTTEDEQYTVYLYFDNGKRLHTFNFKTNLYSFTDFMTRVYLCDDDGNNGMNVYFDKRCVRYDIQKNEIVVPAEGLKFDWYDDDDDDDSSRRRKNPFQKAKPLYMTFSKKSMNSLHYMI